MLSISASFGRFAVELGQIAKLIRYTFFSVIFLSDLIRFSICAYSIINKI